MRLILCKEKRRERKREREKEEHVGKEKEEWEEEERRRRLEERRGEGRGKNLDGEREELREEEVKESSRGKKMPAGSVVREQMPKREESETGGGKECLRGMNASQKYKLERLL